MINRAYIFLALTMLSFFNPVTLIFFKFSSTFIVIVPFTLLIWFAAEWGEISEIREKGSKQEILLGVAIYSLNLMRNLLTFNEKPMFGLSDMLIAFICVSLAYYGVKGIRKFILPIAYMTILVVGYQLEFMITEVVFLENFLAQTITAMLNFLGIHASANANLVILQTPQDTYQFIIDSTCTGIKGMLAYGSLAVLMVIDVKTTRKRKIICIAVGAIGTFLVNILRLFTIFISCYFFGQETAMAVHTYLGYSLFIVWVIIFSAVSLKYLVTPKEKTGNSGKLVRT